ncbi:hypothetical protein ACFXAS_05600 [Streptomyces sp. NPDC059459]|uniref:hypothetical protein n=1 Tax=Streptomyces sp. NPDC059459 TaxID=3346839 RepID=UPI0036792D35
MSGERERQQMLRAKAAEIVAGLPAWDNKSPSVWVVIIDPETRQRLTQWRTPAAAAPQVQPGPQTKPAGRTRHLRAVPDAS